MQVSCSSRIVLFDFDGVVIRPGDHNRREWEHFGETYGFDDPAALHDRVLGLSTERGLALLAELPHSRPYDVQEALAEYDRHSLSNNDGIEVTPGAGDLLRSLPRERWAIVTTSSRDVTISRLAYFELPVPDLIVSADDVPVGQGKPSPLPYVMAMDALGVVPGDTVIFEDSPTGIAAAQSAYCQKVFVVQSDVPESKIRLRSGDCVVEDFSAVEMADRGGRLTIEGNAIRIGPDLGPSHPKVQTI